MKTILVDAVHTFVLPDEGMFVEMYELLQRYPNPKIILTNANDDQIKKHRIDTLPYEVFTLKHNPDKIDPQYYTTMLEYFGLGADDVIYVEHNEDAVESARGVGITTYHYHRDTKDLISLKTFLDRSIL